MSHVDWSLNLNSLLLGGMALSGAIISARSHRQRAKLEEKADQIHEAVNGNLTGKLAELPTIDQTREIAAQLVQDTAAIATDLAAAGPTHVVIDQPIPTGPADQAEQG